MNKALTKQDILDLFAKGRQEAEERSKRFDAELVKSRKEFHKSLEESSKEFDKKLGRITGDWGTFVVALVKPGAMELFRERGIELDICYQEVEVKKDGIPYYEIDLFYINDQYAVAIEAKSKLDISDIKYHLARLKKIHDIPPRHFKLKGKKLIGAVAAMILNESSERYAIQNGLFVIKQKGNILEIVNEVGFTPTPKIFN